MTNLVDDVMMMMMMMMIRMMIRMRIGLSFSFPKTDQPDAFGSFLSPAFRIRDDTCSS